MPKQINRKQCAILAAGSNHSLISNCLLNFHIWCLRSISRLNMANTELLIHAFPRPQTSAFLNISHLGEGLRHPLWKQWHLWVLLPSAIPPAHPFTNNLGHSTTKSIHFYLRGPPSPKHQSCLLTWFLPLPHRTCQVHPTERSKQSCQSSVQNAPKPSLCLQNKVQTTKPCTIQA